MKLTTAAIALFTLLAVAGCGKKGPLVYPDMLLPTPPQAVMLDQSGPFLRISFDLPQKDRSGNKLTESLESIILLRKVVDSQSCGSCLDNYQLMARIDPQHPAPAIRHGSRIVWIDKDVLPGEQRYQYRIKVVQKDGEAGSFADTIPAAVGVPPAAPVVKARPVFGGMIVVDISSELPAGTALVGYQIYRAASGDPELTPLGGLVRDLPYTDQTVQLGMTYRYAATQVVRPLSGNGVQRESDLSAIVEVMAEADAL